MPLPSLNTRSVCWLFKCACCRFLISLANGLWFRPATIGAVGGAGQADPPCWLWEAGTNSIDKDGRSILIWNTVVHHWRVLVLFHVRLKSLHWTTPSHVTRFAGRRGRPLGETMEVCLCACCLIMGGEANESITELPQLSKSVGK